MSALPAAAACELKDADPAAEPLALTRASPALPKIPVSRYPAASCFSANDFLQPQGAVLKRKDRYDTADLDENQFEPGSRHRVLKNLLGITSKREMDRMEGREQLRVLEELASLYDSDHRFTATDICQMHRLWLGRIYPWAGKYRQMNVKKDSFSFAAAAQISKLMAEFEDGPLKCHTPCRSASMEHLAKVLAEVHVELVLIHPFREGNGRIARILAVLMGLQAGLPALYFDKLSGRKRQEYFAAVRAGLARNYEPMTKLFIAVIERTLQIHGK